MFQPNLSLIGMPVEVISLLSDKTVMTGTLKSIDSMYDYTVEDSAGKIHDVMVSDTDDVVVANGQINMWVRE